MLTILIASININDIEVRISFGFTKRRVEFK
jgi:hypothetical protein